MLYCPASFKCVHSTSCYTVCFQPSCLLLLMSDFVKCFSGVLEFWDPQIPVQGLVLLFIIPLYMCHISSATLPPPCPTAEGVRYLHSGHHDSWGHSSLGPSDKGYFWHFMHNHLLTKATFLFSTIPPVPFFPPYHQCPLTWKCALMTISWCTFT